MDDQKTIPQQPEGGQPQEAGDDEAPADVHKPETGVEIWAFF